MDTRSADSKISEPGSVEVGSADFRKADLRSSGHAEDRRSVGETPEDVAVLYSWANLHGAKYRDFSASRREYRAQMRHRAAELMRIEAEAKALDESQRAIDALVAAEAAKRAATTQAEKDAAEAAAAFASEQAQGAVEAAFDAEEAEARAAAHQALAREAVLQAEAGDRPSSEDVSEAGPTSGVFGSLSDPYRESLRGVVEHKIHKPGTHAPLPAYKPGRPLVTHSSSPSEGTAASRTESPRVEPERPAVGHKTAEQAPPPEQPSQAEQRPEQPWGREERPAQSERARQMEAQQRLEDLRFAEEREASLLRAEQQRQEHRENPPSQFAAEPRGLYSGMPYRLAESDHMAEAPAYEEIYRPASPPPQRVEPAPAFRYGFPPQDRRQVIRGGESVPAGEALDIFAPGPRAKEGYRSAEAAREPARAAQRQPEFTVPAGRPAWLYESEVAVAAARAAATPAAPVAPTLGDTLQQSRERVASRWFALKGVFDGADQQQDAQPARQKEARTPVLALFSLAGGVGKTSMVATLGRALASLGEKTLLTDTTSYGLLPFYFGARELRPGTMRTFSPPSGSTDAPINLINMDVEGKPAESSGTAPGHDWLVEEITRNARGTNRVVIDLATASGSLTRRILRMGPVVLVPVSPDLNSVISLSAAEQFFQNQNDAEGRAVKVFFLLNQFDASQPLHLDVREVLRQQLGDRLLPFVIRRSAAVSEALAEGMTVMDYAPHSPVAEDYMSLATWVRTTSAPVSLGFRGVRWSEQR